VRRERRLWIAAATVVGLSAAAVLAFIVPRLPAIDGVKLRYTAEFGVDWVGDWRLLGMFPALGAAFVVVDWLLAHRLRRVHPSLGEAMAVAAVVVSLSFATATVISLLLNAAPST
jgi:hypothetical protein